MAKNYIDNLSEEPRKHTRIQNRIDAHLDKLDGRVDANFFDHKATEWRAEQARIRSDIDAH